MVRPLIGCRLSSVSTQAWGIGIDVDGEGGHRQSEGSQHGSLWVRYPDLERRYPRTIIVQKPASAEVLLASMAGLIAGDPLERLDVDEKRANGVSEQKLHRARSVCDREPSSGV